MKKCRYGDRWVPYEYLDGTMLEDRVVRYERHLKGCLECVLKVQELRDFDALLQESKSFV